MTALDEVNNENNFVKSNGKAGDAGEEASADNHLRKRETIR